MKITIIPEDDMVTIDGESRAVDCSSLPPNIHAVQYDSVAEEGMIELKNVDAVTKHFERPIKNAGQFQLFQSMVAAWETTTLETPPSPAKNPSKDVNLGNAEAQYISNPVVRGIVMYIAKKEGRPTLDVWSDIKDEISTWVDTV